MKNLSTPVVRTLAFGLLVLSSPLSFAQTAPRPSTAGESSRGNDDDQVITLTPFEVSATSNAGYRATDTLAGARIRTELRDIGSAVSVVTQQFLRDTGATNNATLLQYTTSTEVGGPGGNFAGVGDSALVSDQGQRQSPNNSTRVRGLVSADNTRGFFLTDIPWDSYNTNRIDIQRGANSLLFGNGSGAGIINGSLDDAVFKVNSATVELRYGQYGSYRGSLNVNRDVIPGQLALRIATLYDKDYFKQDPAYSRDKRYYGALRFEPAFLKKGNARTTLKVNLEHGDIDANRPRTITPYDAISPWFRQTPQDMVDPNGVKLGTLYPLVSHDGYNPWTYDIQNSAALRAANPNDRSIGAHQQGGSYSPNTEGWLWAGAGNAVNGDWFTSLGAIFPDPNSSQMSYYLNGGTSGYLYNAINSAGARDGNIQGLRAAQLVSLVRLAEYVQYNPSSGNLPYTSGNPFLYQASGVYRSTTLSDPSIFDFFNKLLDGPNKKEWQKFDAFNASLDQTFFNGKAGFQLAYDYQKNTQGRFDMLGGNPTISIDVWKYLPVALLNPATGLLEPVLNPNFGRPYIVASSGGSERITNRDTWRATPYVDLDFKALLPSDNWATKILGRHTFTGLLEGNKTVSKSRNWTHYSLDDTSTASLLGPGQQVNGTTRKIVTVSYLGGPAASAPSLSGLNLSNITALQQPRNGPAWYFDSNYRSTAPAPNTAWTAGSTIGLAPNQNGVSAANQFQAENPANYNGYSAPNSNGQPATTVGVLNADFGDIDRLTTGATRRRDETNSWALIDQWALLSKTIVVTAGVRKDKVDSFQPLGTGNRPIKPDGVVDFAAPFDDPTTPTATFKSPTLKTWSVVGHSPEFINRHLPWGLKGSVFFNRSENFRPVGRVGIVGEALSPPSGDTRDYGVLLEAFEGRVSFKVNWFKTNVRGDTITDLASNGLQNRIGDEVQRGLQFAYSIINHSSNNGTYNYTYTRADGSTGVSAYQPATGSAATWTEADWVAADALAQSHARAFLDATLPETVFLQTWGMSDPASRYSTTAGNSGIAYAVPAGFAFTGDTVSRGREYELYLRPTDHWNIAINASNVHASRLNLAGSVSAWIEKRWDLYQGPAGQLRWFGGSQGAAVSDTGIARMGRNAWAVYNLFRSQEGNDTPELRPWRFNITNSYNFSQGKMKGIFVGGGYRWQDRNVIGYGVTEKTPALSPSNPAIGYLDVNKPYHGPSQDAVDLWIGYNRRLFKTIDWRLQLNVRNAFDKAHLVPINTNPDGSIAAWAVADGASWELTSVFKF